MKRRWGRERVVEELISRRWEQKKMASVTEGIRGLKILSFGLTDANSGTETRETAVGLIGSAATPVALVQQRHTVSKPTSYHLITSKWSSIVLT